MSFKISERIFSGISFVIFYYIALGIGCFLVWSLDPMKEPATLRFGLLAFVAGFWINPVGFL